MAGAKGKGKKIEFGIQGDPDSFKEIKPRADESPEFSKESRPSPAAEASTKPATLVNKLSHSVILSYNGEGMMIHPQQRAVIANIDKLGATPRGVVVIRNSGK